MFFRQNAQSEFIERRLHPSIC